ncbi:SpoIVB peptidase [Sporolactobacillus shoreae]|uniref:SpoIVB peptidase n=1 Tax=Sporolactobacillus shoreae TaxID=1465501 RepID=A0A4Z0GK85_9BACL|nr:SpoIVB peptidase [Sporolactobacillus shoreae]TGA96379.1 SpoIVB peptidase [Sporolactobacillus shoreae]
MGKRKKKLGVLAGLILLGFLIAFFCMKTGQITGYVLKAADTAKVEGQSFRSGLAAGSPIAMEVKKIKTFAVHERQKYVKTQTVFFMKKPETFSEAHTGGEIHLIPGGQSIGVRISTRGVLVVGYHLVSGPDGKLSPGENAGIKIGDVITKINGKPITTIADVRSLVTHVAKSQTLTVDVLRRTASLQKKLIPVKDSEGSLYELGLYIRDSASGIGTMTFYDPETSSYGALGHVISDKDTGQPIIIKTGHIVNSTVQAIDKGAEGKPGEKIAFFSENAANIGSVEKNTPFGIYGHLKGRGMLRSSAWDKGLPAASADEVREGPAQILTVLNGTRVQAFDILILNSVPQKYPATKGLVIKVTDKRLLQSTGGIIQGMSGSPIIQNGKLVGAVTHVFVNDPTCGYGVHIEWMLQEAGMDSSKNQRMQQAAS